ncbi:MAG TPA: fatty acyl-AMP ligase, partial [Vicinamibacteria bacterium]
SMAHEVGGSNLVEVLKRRASDQPDRRAYAFLENGDEARHVLTYRELDEAARRIAARLLALGAEGERAFLLYPPGLEFIQALFGCFYAGVGAIPAPVVRRSLPRLEAVARDARASFLLTDSRTRPQLEAGDARPPEFEAMRWVVTDEAGGPPPGPVVPGPPGGATLAYLQYTSGSTATPKGVMVTHANLVRHCADIAEAWGYGPDGASVTWVPHFHDYGLVDGILLPLYAGIPCYVMSPAAFYMRPNRWLRAIARYRVTHTQGPDSGYEHCLRRLRPDELAGLDLGCWRTASDGGEPVRPGTVRGFVSALAPFGFRESAFYPAYGLAEATLLVATKRTGDAPVVRAFDSAALEAHRAVAASPGGSPPVREVTSCGPPIGSLRIAIADPHTRARCVDGAVGEVWVSGPGLATGYWDNPGETERTFGARLAGSGEGPFLRTGDLGFVKDGELFVTGRIKDVIIIRGRNHYPQDVELTVERSHPALRPGHGAAFSVEVGGEERLVVVQEVERSHLRRVVAEDVAADVREAVAEAHELQLHALVLARPGSVPRTSSGKVRRRACRAQFLEGTLAAIGVGGGEDAEGDPRLEAGA